MRYNSVAIVACRRSACAHGQVYEPSPELGLWVRKQRAAKEQGTLPEERLRILLELGFEFGEEANITEEWELRFDLLMELLFMRVCHLSFAHCNWGTSCVVSHALQTSFQEHYPVGSREDAGTSVLVQHE